MSIRPSLDDDLEKFEERRQVKAFRRKMIGLSIGAGTTMWVSIMALYLADKVTPLWMKAVDTGIGAAALIVMFALLGWLGISFFAWVDQHM
jgi:hypothetical protein